MWIKHIHKNINGISSFQNGLNCFVQLVSVSIAKLCDVDIKCKNIMFFNFQDHFLKMYIFEILVFALGSWLFNQLTFWRDNKNDTRDL